MGQANKWVGGGRTGASKGDMASGGSSVNGKNGSSFIDKKVSGPRGPGMPNAKVYDRVILGDKRDTGTISSHNSIDTFLKGAKSRGPYGGPSFRSLSNVYKDMQATNRSSVSDFETPSGSARRNTSGKMDRSAGDIRRGHGTGSGNL